MNFNSIYVYDVTFLVVFAAFVSYFLYTRRHNLKREGLLFLYKAGWGIKLIDKVGNRYKKTLGILSYLSIITGYILMVAMFYLLGKIVYLYVAFPAIVREIKIPPITPLIPYLPQVFQLDFLPPFYFTYWIVIIAIIAISHEFSHGIFAAYDKIKIKSTGFGFFPFFLPIFLAAFVELDEKNMAKKKIKSQLAILSAGTFANVLTAVLFFGVLWIFFTSAFAPSGIIFDTYPYASIAISSITSVNGIPVNNPNNDAVLGLMNDEGLNKMEAGKDFVTTKKFFEEQKNNGQIIVYYDAPAINAELERIILKINGKETTSIDSIEKEILNHAPGDKITLTLLNKDGESYDKDIVLGENPGENGKAWLGIGFTQQRTSGVLGKIYLALSSFKKQGIYYEPKFDGISVFIYNLLWWLVLISISVALVNMLPVGIFDGGRFFYLTILGLTKNEKKAKSLFSLMTYFILFLVFVLMIFWAVSFF
ncbi:site-2 protease family protein [Candidatus Pacearchaeota archaeon]|nr:site-2 protease family protein [Candidatus Pacearchaeota archaeon]